MIQSPMSLAAAYKVNEEDPFTCHYHFHAHLIKPRRDDHLGGSQSTAYSVLGVLPFV